MPPVMNPPRAAGFHLPDIDAARAVIAERVERVYSAAYHTLPDDQQALIRGTVEPYVDQLAAEPSAEGAPADVSAAVAELLAVAGGPGGLVSAIELRYLGRVVNVVETYEREIEALESDAREAGLTLSEIQVNVRALQERAAADLDTLGKWISRALANVAAWAAQRETDWSAASYAVDPSTELVARQRLDAIADADVDGFARLLAGVRLAGDDASKRATERLARERVPRLGKYTATWARELESYVAAITPSAVAAARALPDMLQESAGYMRRQAQLMRQASAPDVPDAPADALGTSNSIM